MGMKKSPDGTSGTGNDIIGLTASRRTDAVVELKKAQHKLEVLEEEASDEEKVKLNDKSQKIGDKIIELEASDINKILNSPDVQKALDKLSGITLRIKKEAEEMGNATAALERVSSILDLADKAIGIFRG